MAYPPLITPSPKAHFNGALFFNFLHELLNFNTLRLNYWFKCALIF